MILKACTEQWSINSQGLVKLGLVTIPTTPGEGKCTHSDTYNFKKFSMIVTDLLNPSMSGRCNSTDTVSSAKKKKNVVFLFSTYLTARSPVLFLMHTYRVSCCLSYHMPVFAWQWFQSVSITFS